MLLESVERRLLERNRGRHDHWVAFLCDYQDGEVA
jgi:hypothetical protein